MFSYFQAAEIPLTVFAPSNEAFQKLPKDTMEKIKTNLTFNHSKNNSYVFYVNAIWIGKLQYFLVETVYKLFTFLKGTLNY